MIDKPRPGPRYRDEWPDVERIIELPPVDYVRHPHRVPPAPFRRNWADRLIDVLIEHQVAFSLLLWFVIIGVGLIVWLSI